MDNSTTNELKSRMPLLKVYTHISSDFDQSSNHARILGILYKINVNPYDYDKYYSVVKLMANSIANISEKLNIYISLDSQDPRILSLDYTICKDQISLNRFLTSCLIHPNYPEVATPENIDLTVTMDDEGVIVRTNYSEEPIYMSYDTSELLISSINKSIDYLNSITHDFYSTDENTIIISGSRIYNINSNDQHLVIDKLFSNNYIFTNSECEVMMDGKPIEFHEANTIDYYRYIYAKIYLLMTNQPFTSDSKLEIINTLFLLKDQPYYHPELEYALTLCETNKEQSLILKYLKNYLIPHPKTSKQLPVTKLSAYDLLRSISNIDHISIYPDPMLKSANSYEYPKGELFVKSDELVTIPTSSMIFNSNSYRISVRYLEKGSVYLLPKLAKSVDLDNVLEAYRWRSTMIVLDGEFRTDILKLSISTPEAKSQLVSLLTNAGYYDKYADLNNNDQGIYFIDTTQFFSVNDYPYSFKGLAETTLNCRILKCKQKVLKGLVSSVTKIGYYSYNADQRKVLEYHSLSDEGDKLIYENLRSAIQNSNKSPTIKVSISGWDSLPSYNSIITNYIDKNKEPKSKTPGYSATTWMYKIYKDYKDKPNDVIIEELESTESQLNAISNHQLSLLYGLLMTKPVDEMIAIDSPSAILEGDNNPKLSSCQFMIE